MPAFVVSLVYTPLEPPVEVQDSIRRQLNYVSTLKYLLMNLLCVSRSDFEACMPLKDL
jgi:hypothetical protein